MHLYCTWEYILYILAKVKYITSTIHVVIGLSHLIKDNLPIFAYTIVLAALLLYKKYMHKINRRNWFGRSLHVL